MRNPSSWFFAGRRNLACRPLKRFSPQVTRSHLWSRSLIVLLAAIRTHSFAREVGRIERRALTSPSRKKFVATRSSEHGLKPSNRMRLSWWLTGA